MAPMVSGTNTKRYVKRRFANSDTYRDNIAASNTPLSESFAIAGWQIYEEIKTSRFETP